MQTLDVPNLKLGLATRVVPEELLAGVAPLTRPPRVGELAVATVLTIGRRDTLETRAGENIYLFPGDVVVGVFGHRYATDQYEAYVPDRPVGECDLLSGAGVCGEVASRHAAMAAPTRLRLLGLASDHLGAPLSMRDFGLTMFDAEGAGHRGEVILVVGSSMNAGKTTTAGTIVRALTRAGATVAAAKITGTAAGKDPRYLRSCGARPVLDFTDAGYPSTYLAESDDLLGIFRVLLSHLRSAGPDFVVLEVADGLVQRETRLLLESAEFRANVDHVFFAAGDSMSAAYGAGLLRELDLPLRAVSGALTQSSLAAREAEAAAGVPCLSMDGILTADLRRLLAQAPAPPVAARLAAV